MRRKVLGLAAVLSLALILPSYLWLFRQKNLDLQELGAVQLKWHWGRAREVHIDRNRDGVIDLRAQYIDDAKEFFTHRLWSEYWASTNCNGEFDVHYKSQQDGSYTVEIDQDNDGFFETVLQAEDLTGIDVDIDCWGHGGIPVSIPGPK